MYTFFEKKNIFIKVLLIITLVFISDNLILIFLGDTADGKVIRYVDNPSGGVGYPSIRYPQVQFQVKEIDYKFNGNWDADYHAGDIVPVIYRPWWPKKARINTFWGIAKRPLIQCIVVLVLWSLIYSSFKPKVKRKTFLNGQQLHNDKLINH
jgi:hypothetical protein